METQVILLQVAAILVSARLLGELAVKLGTPRVIGELVAGIVLGPSLIGWVEPSEPIKLLAEIGIILLLFEIGLESDLQRLIGTGSRSLVLALGGFTAPLLLGFGISYYTFGLPLLVALFIGGTLTATSIGVTVRILSDLGRQTSREGVIVLGAAVLDDILGVVLLALLYEFSTAGSVSLTSAGRVVAFVALFFVFAPVAAKLLSYLMHHLHKRSDAPGAVPVMLVALVLSFAAFAQTIGVPQLLGGFAAGIALSRRFFLPLGLTLKLEPDFHRLVQVEMKPIIRLFTPIFFVTVGLSLDLSAIDWGSSFFWLFSITLTLVAIVGKIIGGLLISESRYLRVVSGMEMVPRGEVGLIFAELGRLSGVFDNEIYAAAIIVVAYTTLFSPFWIKLFYRLYGEQMGAAEEGAEEG